MSEITEELTNVFQNSDTLARTEFDAVKTVEYVEPNDFEKNMLKNTFTPNELLEKEADEADEDGFRKFKEGIDKATRRKEYITRVKVIALDRLGHKPLSNPSYFSKDIKAQITVLMDHIIKDMSEQEIQEEFNEICRNKIFYPGSDASNLPIQFL